MKIFCAPTKKFKELRCTTGKCSPKSGSQWISLWSNSNITAVCNYYISLCWRHNIHIFQKWECFHAPIAILGSSWFLVCNSRISAAGIMKYRNPIAKLVALGAWKAAAFCHNESKETQRENLHLLILSKFINIGWQTMYQSAGSFYVQQVAKRTSNDQLVVLCKF